MEKPIERLQFSEIAAYTGVWDAWERFLGKITIHGGCFFCLVHMSTAPTTRNRNQSWQPSESASYVCFHVRRSGRVGSISLGLIC